MENVVPDYTKNRLVGMQRYMIQIAQSEYNHTSHVLPLTDMARLTNDHHDNSF